MQKLLVVLSVFVAVLAVGKAVEVVSKPGSCPSVLPVFIGSCTQECASDDGCPAEQKCCSTGCWKVCRTPEATDGAPCSLSCLMGTSCRVVNGQSVCTGSGVFNN